MKKLVKFQIDSGTDGIVPDGGSVDRTTTTQSDGTYAFADLPPGIYTLTQTQPVGYLDGKRVVIPVDLDHIVIEVGVPQVGFGIPGL